MAHQSAPPPENEAERIAALERLQILDTAPERLYDDIVALAKTICSTPIALISLIDHDRQWFKACIGLPVSETDRDSAFCAHAILSPEALMIVEDAAKDPRFRENPLVTGGPQIRFYAGAPIVTDEGLPLGTVCVIDTKPSELSATQQDALRSLARQTASLFKMRQLVIERDRQTEALHSKVISALSDDVSPSRLGQRQRVASIGELTSGVAHDFNNLLQAISVSFQLIERKSDDTARVRRWSEEGIRAVERGARLIAQLLSFSREKTPELAAVNVSACIDEMRDLLSRVTSSGIRLQFDLQPTPVPVLCDSTQLEAAIINMVVNSRDAMNGQGDIRISTRLQEITCHPVVCDGIYLELRVTDTGPGMPYSVASKIFEPFFTTKPEGKGTGLGLSQVQGFAMRAGGSAKVETSPGKGTSIVLLLKPASESAGLDSVLRHAQDAPPAGKMIDVLFVDDRPDLIRGLGELLQNAGYRVRLTTSGIDALVAIREKRPDVVVSDFGMSGLSGRLLAQVVNELERTLPIIFITGAADLDSIRENLPENATVLQKPFPAESLIDALRTVSGSPLQ